MSRRILVGLSAARALRLSIAFLILALLGRTVNTNAQTDTILHAFGSSPTDGYYPGTMLVQGSDGNLYGTTGSGGASTNCYEGCGTVFRISPSGSYTSLYSFVGSPTDGALPGTLVQGSDGNFYGTTAYGGATSNSSCSPLGCGTVFRISPSGSYTSLYFFGSSPTDGSLPCGLVQGRDGDFYGTTEDGGTYTFGTMFRISASGSYTSLYSFGSSPADGEYPGAGLVQGNDGDFYGTTDYGGNTNFNNGYGAGTVFRISPTGSHTNLYSFAPISGEYPGGLVRGTDGNFYGTAPLGGPGTYYGFVFRISPSGNYTNLFFFGSLINGGTEPNSTLVQGCDGNFYGTTSLGGTNPDNYGIVFGISPTGNYTNLYRFAGPPNDGANPAAGLVQGSDGNLYGTTGDGGNTNCHGGCGTVFKLAIPLNPPANQISAVQTAGKNVAISIPSVAGETYQLQFSTSMNPTNWVNVPGVSVTNSIGALLTLTNSGAATGPQGFYRFAITP